MGSSRKTSTPAVPEDPRTYPEWRRSERIGFLERRRKAVIADMMIKAEGEDWHGVQDCASDLRDTDNELDGLRF